MNDRLPRTFIFPGLNSRVVDPACFSVNAEDAERFQTLLYPGWPQYVQIGFSGDKLVEHFAAQIAECAPEGHVRIIGLSVGAHLGYAAALSLQASGYKIDGFCAVDPYAETTASTTAGWQVRAVREAAALLGDRRYNDFGRFLRSRFWRAQLRLAGDPIAGSARRRAPSGRLPWILALDPIFEQELNMRLLIRELAPWVPVLDREPVALKTPAVLLRLRSNEKADAIWRRRCPRIQVLEIPGDHNSLIEENLGSIRELFVAATRDWD